MGFRYLIPHSPIRSVAELVLGEIFASNAQYSPQANADVHRSLWNKSAVGSHEVRGKKNGYRGVYGHTVHQ